MHSIVTTFRGAVIKVEVANFCAAMDTLIDQDGVRGEMDQISTNTSRYTTCCAANAYMFVYIFMGTHIAPLKSGDKKRGKDYLSSM